MPDVHREFLTLKLWNATERRSEDVSDEQAGGTLELEIRMRDSIHKHYLRY